MYVGILQTAYKLANDYGGDYNVQELGLARALARMGHKVVLYKAVKGARESMTEYDGNLTVSFLNVNYIGINGMINAESLDKTLDVLIYFSDTQLKVKQVNEWCKRNKVRYIPYIGVIESHSENAIKRMLMDILTKRNISVYRDCTVLAKTPGIKNELEELACRNVQLFPVGLDETVMYHGDKMHDDPVNNGIDDSLYARRKAEEKARRERIHLLYIGRMEAEKQPLEMLRIFEKMLSIRPNLSLTMIGSGNLYSEVEDKAEKINQRYGYCITLLKKVPYKDIHTYYEDANLFINLNRVEILGMSILEAMYYECPVLAIDAPGPRFILGSEYVANDIVSLERILEKYIKGEYSQDEIGQYIVWARNRVLRDFTWDALTPKLMDIIRTVF